MTLNRLKKIWDNGEYALNGWLSINNSFIAEIMSRQNYSESRRLEHPEGAHARLKQGFSKVR